MFIIAILYLALELAEQESDDDEEGQAGHAGEDDEDGLLQPAGGVCVAQHCVVSHLTAVIET